MLKQIKTIALTAILLILIPSITYAEECRTTKSGDFSDSSVWDCAHAPMSSDSIFIESDHSLNIDQNIAVTNIVFQGNSSLTANSYTITLSGSSLVEIPPGSSFNQGTSTVKMSDANHRTMESLTFYNLQWETPITAARTE